MGKKDGVEEREFFEFLMSKEKPFYIDTFRKLLGQYDSEEISLSKVVEELNRTAYEWNRSRTQKEPSGQSNQLQQGGDGIRAVPVEELWKMVDYIIGKLSKATEMPPTDCTKFDISDLWYRWLAECLFFKRCITDEEIRSRTSEQQEEIIDKIEAIYPC